MDSPQFWEIIERAHGDADAVEAELAKLTADEIESWHRMYYDHHNALHRWDLWGAAYVIKGGCSDDAFHYFKAWLIGKGRAVYEAALADPDSIGPFITEEDLEGDCENESLNYAAEKAYEAASDTGKELDRNSNESGEPRGEPWEEEELEELFPKLAARFSNAQQERKSSPDGDRLSQVFAALNAKGIIALENAGETMSDGSDHVMEVCESKDKKDVMGYCFYHGQDLERAKKGGGLYLAFGPVDPEKEETEGPKVGRVIVEELERRGFTVKWDGTFKERILVEGLDWKKGEQRTEPTPDFRIVAERYQSRPRKLDGHLIARLRVLQHYPIRITISDRLTRMLSITTGVLLAAGVGLWLLSRQLLLFPFAGFALLGAGAARIEFLRRRRDEFLDMAREGHMALACVVLANSKLFQPGDEPFPAAVVFSLDEQRHLDEQYLSALAEQVGRLREMKAPPSPDMKPAWQFIQNDGSTGCAQIPSSTCGNEMTFLSNVIIDPRILPGRCLTGRMVPVLVAPRPRILRMVLVHV